MRRMNVQHALECSRVAKFCSEIFGVDATSSEIAFANFR